MTLENFRLLILGNKPKSEVRNRNEPPYTYEYVNLIGKEKKNAKHNKRSSSRHIA